MRKVLAVIESDAVRDLLGRSLAGDCDLTLCGDALEGSRLLLEQEPEGVIVDMYLPGITGLTFLEQNQSRLPPVVLVLSGLASPYVLRTVSRLGAGFLIRTPCTMEEVRRRLEDMFRLPRNQEPDPARLHLRRLRFCPGLAGYRYLCAAIDLYAGDKGQSLTKELYPAVAAQFGTTAQGVEHGIREAIRDAWEERVEDVWQEYFPQSGKCPTNRLLIAALAELR